MTTPFILLTQAHSGEEILSRLLEGHPLVSFHKELFRPAPGTHENFNTFADKIETEDGALSEHQRQAIIPQYLNALFSGNNLPATGFELHMDQLETNPGLQRWIKTVDIFVIHLVYGNPLRVLLSAAQTDSMHEEGNPSGTRTIATALPEGEALLAALSRIADTERRIEKFARSKRHITVHYEDLQNNMADAAAPVFFSLGLHADLVSTSLKTIDTPPLNSAVTNYPAVRDTLSGTEFERFLDNKADATSLAHAPTTLAPVVHLHIPKSGGSSLETILHKVLRRERVFMAYPHLNGHVSDYARLPFRDKLAFKAISGHFSYEIRGMLPAGSRCVTILRHPVDRIISSYYMFLHVENHPRSLAIKNRNITLEQFADPAYGFQQDNIQTKYVAGVPRDQACTEAHLERAIHVLSDELATFGILERFAESIFLFAKAFGWSSAPLNHNGLNTKRPKRESLDRSVLAQVTRHNLHDMHLYALAYRLFDDRMQQLWATCPDQLRAHMGQDVHISKLKNRHPWRDSRGNILASYRS